MTNYVNDKFMSLNCTRNHVINYTNLVQKSKQTFKLG